MASDGIANKAKHGTCRMCQRVRNTEKHLNAVGEVRHGFATGHVWECTDYEDCDKAALKKLDANITGDIKQKIKTAIEVGRIKFYTIWT